MNTLNAIESRRSIKHYKKKAVSKDDLFTLVEMAKCAPTAGNLQEIQYIIVTDKDKIKGVCAPCMDQNWMGAAPALIVVCSQPNQQGEWFGERGKHVFSTQDAAAATQTILIAATELGLGSCWVSGFDQEQVDAYFDVEDARVEAIITIGYPDEKPGNKTLRPLLGSVFFNDYGQNFEDPIAINKDYSIKLQKRLQEIENQEKEMKSSATKFLDSAAKKLKEAHKKYVVKK